MASAGQKRITCAIRGSRIVLQDATEVKVIDAAAIKGINLVGKDDTATKAIKLDLRGSSMPVAFVTDDMDNATTVMSQLVTAMADVTMRKEAEDTRKGMEGMLGRLEHMRVAMERVNEESNNMRDERNDLMIF